MKWLCKIFEHSYVRKGSTMYVDSNFTHRHWVCKRCGDKVNEYVPHELIWHDY